MDNALYASMDVIDCNMPCVCENASMSVYPHDCDVLGSKKLGTNVLELQFVLCWQTMIKT